jgi:hypothetical protein
MMRTRRMKRCGRNWIVSMMIIVASTGIVWAYGGGGGGGGGGANDSPFTGLTPQQLADIFGSGFKPPAAGGTVDIGSPPAAAGIGPGISWNGVGQIPDGFPKLTPKQKAQIEQAFNEAMAKGYLDDAAKADLGEKIAKIIGLGAAVGAGIVGGLAAAGPAAATVTAIGIAGDGLAAGAGAFTESVTQGKSASEALGNGLKAGAAKATVSAITSKIQTGSDAANAVFGTVVGIGYDEAPSSAVPNSAPPPPVIYAPISMPQIVPPIVPPQM